MLLFTLSDNIIDMQILYLVAEIGTSGTKILIFHVMFLNKDMSVTTVNLTITFYMTASHIHSKG